MSFSSALQLSTSLGPIVSARAPPAATAPIPPPVVHLNQSNFMLWRTLTVPKFTGAGLHGYLNGTTAAPEQTIVQGSGDAAIVVPNPACVTWWQHDQWVLGLLLESLGKDIACQMIGKTTTASVWAVVHSMFSAQNKANVRHLRHQIQALRKEDMPAAECMNKVNALADTMAAAGSPLGDDEITRY